jgi:hypothetical protein
LLELSWQPYRLETSKPSELEEHAVPGALIADRPLSARFLQTVVAQKPRKLGTCGPWFHGQLRPKVTQRLSGTWKLGSLSSQELESQKTGEQQSEETGCHGSKEPGRLLEVGAIVPRDVQKLGKWVSRHLTTSGTGDVGIYWPRKQGILKPRGPEDLGSRDQGRKGPRKLGVEQPWNQ